MAEAKASPSGAAPPWVLPVAVIGLTTVVYAAHYLPLMRTESIGNDWDIFLPYLLAGDYWFATNGLLSVPWMTPASCGGIPFYANPQSIYYSPAQWLSFAVSPLTAVRLVFVGYAVAGGVGMYLLLKRSFRLSSAAAVFGAVAFMFNGFFAHRMVIGHFAMQGFMLTPLAAWVLLRTGSLREQAINGLLGGVLFTLMFQSGMVVLVGPVGLALVWIGLARARLLGGIRDFFTALGISLATAGALCAAKLTAAAAFVSHFPRDYLPLPGVAALPNLVGIVLRLVFWRATPDVEKMWTNTRVRMAIHEWEYSLSPLPMAIIALGLYFHLSNRMRRPAPPNPARRSLTAALVVLALIPLALNLYSPSWTAFLKHLPIIKDSSSLSRWFCFYLPVAPVLSALCADMIPTRFRSVSVGLGIVGVLVFHVTEGAGHIPDQHYLPASIEAAWQRLHDTDQVTPIDRVVIARRTDGRAAPGIGNDNAITGGASQGACYEALFGYKLQTFPFGAMHDGPALEATDGLLNIKNPACFVYPTENHCAPGDQFSADRIREATAFVSWRPIAFEVSPLQQLADWVNALALLTVPAALFLLIRRRTTSGGIRPKSA